MVLPPAHFAACWQRSSAVAAVAAAADATQLLAVVVKLLLAAVAKLLLAVADVLPAVDVLRHAVADAVAWESSLASKPKWLAVQSF